MIDMLRERNADILPEHTAEIVAVEAEDVSDLLKRERFHIMFVNVGYDFPDPELIAAGFREIFFI